ncbi:MAG: hypothetical protein IT384_11615 [Deltaproteobacteria bacterium]|nr:hypothetical protein [Deltaproteobacteria bacterium]
MYPTIHDSAIQIGSNSYVSRSAVDSDRDAVYTVRPEKQQADPIPLSTFMRNPSDYFVFDHKASTLRNLAALKGDLTVVVTGRRNDHQASRWMNFERSLINAIDAVTHAVQWGLGR